MLGGARGAIGRRSGRLAIDTRKKLHCFCFLIISTLCELVATDALDFSLLGPCVGAVEVVEVVCVKVGVGLVDVVGESVFFHPLVAQEFGHVVADRVSEQNNATLSCAVPQRRRCESQVITAATNTQGQRGRQSVHTFLEGLGSQKGADHGGSAGATAEQSLFADQAAGHNERLLVVGFDPVVNAVFAGASVDVSAVGEGDAGEDLRFASGSTDGDQFQVECPCLAT